MSQSEYKIPANLYHYTDQNGFLGIVNNHELWATKILYLNDNLEFKLAMEIADDVIKEKMASPRNENEQNLLGAIVSEMFMAGKDSVYVCSFSENDDLLSQWRGYSKGMAGYSLGFDGGLLNQVAVKKGFVLNRCIYDTHEQRRFIKMAVEILLDKYNFLYEVLEVSVLDSYKKSGPDIKTVIEDINDKFLRIFPLMKHESFKEEAEWRLISREPTNPTDLCFRPGISSLIPFRKINDNSLISECMTEVVVGHTPNSQLAIASTQEFLRSKNLKVPVRGTDIPFRSW